MRIYIVGGPGSGKSSLADALGLRARVTPVHLDDHWDRTFERDAVGGVSARALAYRRWLVDDVLARSDWIVEGAEPPFLRVLGEASDVIVWCDIPFATAAARMLRRHVLAELRGTNPFPGYRRLFVFMRSVWRRYVAPEASGEEWSKWTHARVRTEIRPFASKVMRSRGGSSAREVDGILARVARA